MRSAWTVNSLLMALDGLGLAGVLRPKQATLDYGACARRGLQVLGEVEDSEGVLPRSSLSAQSPKPPASKLLLVGEVEGFALGEYLVGEVWGDFLEVLRHGL